ncbi:FXYD domain-containing ion transport regulator 5 isoform X1 [Camelus dromedarius]|uniref:FXYD domain-containing ion transport regulator 5 isoform X1 n=2 Tax=Camelus dromedarius TaxID=9838 RepID=UPI001263CA76|nr:FXYD domain-containing ion transport regulator 5 isoform X1 [Camelus dromedarius]XP_031312811.1 FXYD domain-containing ion transport regulator 5 isoform X1 [Camelus dromedarius]XP_031312812.1 FXYD domain-containing ion transport regulator 5 isoform X1 [Camelus dromedarius]
MLPTGCLCLLLIRGLILLTRGQTLQEATSIPQADPTSENFHALTSAPGTFHPELQPTPPISTLQTDVKATPDQMQTQTPQPTEMDVLLTTGLGTDKSSTQGSTPAKTRPPNKDMRRDPAFRPTGSSEEDPFSYDEYTLRKRGLLVAAVLFITGIVILTSGKCRQLPRLCRNSDRTYRVVSKAQPEREGMDGA